MASVWLLAAWGVGAGASVVINIVAARIFPKAFYGDFALVLATLVWVEYSISATFPLSYQKLASEKLDNLPRIYYSIRHLCLPLCLGLWAIFSLASPLMARLLGDTNLTRFFLWAGPDIPILGLYAVSIGVLNGAGRPGHMGASQACYAVGRVVFITGVMVVLKVGLGADDATSVSGGLFAKACASGFGLVVAIRFLRRIPHGTPSGPLTRMGRHVIRYGVPLGVTTVALYLLINVDFWLVKALLKDDDAAAYFGAARAVAFLAIFVGIAMRNAVFPAMAWNLHRGRVKEGLVALRTALRVVLLVAGMLVALLPATATDLSMFLFKYHDAGPPMVFLVIATSLFAVLMVYVMAFAAADRPREPLVLLAGLVPLAVTAHYLVIPRMGAPGAALVTMCTMGVGVAAASVLLWTRLRARPPVVSILRIGGVAVAVALVSRLAPATGWLLLVKYAVMGSAYAALLLIVREVRPAEVGKLVLALKRKLGKAQR